MDVLERVSERLDSVKYIRKRDKRDEKDSAND